jgi:hypothetical protein
MAVALVAACGHGSTAPPPPPPRGPAIVALEVPEPVLEGSRLVARAAVRGEPELELQLRHVRGIERTLVRDRSRDDLAFVVTRDDLEAFGEGRVGLTAVLLAEGVAGLPLETQMTFARALPVTLTRVTTGDVTRNELAILEGSGFLYPGEGTLVARVVGSFYPDGGGAAVDVHATVPVAALEPGRRRAAMLLGTELGGIEPGRLEGMVALESTLRSGSSSSSEVLPLRLRFGPPLVAGLHPTTASLEQLVTVRGAGFLGGAERPREATFLRLRGTFTPSGGTPRPFGPVELVPRFVSGSELRFALDAIPSGGTLVSELFGTPAGSFRGELVAVTVLGTSEVATEPTPVELELAPLVQVVWLRFLPQFYQALQRFGLAAAGYGLIEERIAARVRELYAGYRVDVRLERPDDFDVDGYATVEIGGPDPGGTGLFGFDNTPGKDVGNLRLFDAIGGANAETQADGYPGYGGVFVESMLYWSAHPELPGPRPPGAPDPDPLFDAIFDPVRRAPATADELRGGGSGGRRTVVERALRAFAYVVAETTAHELGHSLGLALPYGPPTAFHDAEDLPGCLMDAGGARPFGERAGEPGFSATRFCHDAPRYLDEILGGGR